MPTLSIERAQEQLSRLPEQLAGTAEEPTVTITRRGKPVLAVMSWEFYESVMETLEILRDENQIADLRRGIEEADRGQTRPWAELKAELSL